MIPTIATLQIRIGPLLLTALKPRVISKYDPQNYALIADAAITRDYVEHIAARGECLSVFDAHLPGSFKIRSSGWFRSSNPIARLYLLGALVFPFDRSS